MGEYMISFYFLLSESCSSPSCSSLSKTGRDKAVKSLGSISIRLLTGWALISPFSQDRKPFMSHYMASQSHTKRAVFYSNILKNERNRKGYNHPALVWHKPIIRPLCFCLHLHNASLSSSYPMLSQRSITINRLTSEMFLSVSFRFSSSFRSMPTIPTARVLPACRSTKDGKKY